MGLCNSGGPCLARLGVGGSRELMQPRGWGAGEAPRSSWVEEASSPMPCPTQGDLSPVPPARSRGPAGKCGRRLGDPSRHCSPLTSIPWDTDGEASCGGRLGRHPHAPPCLGAIPGVAGTCRGPPLPCMRSWVPVTPGLGISKEGGA